MRSMLKDIDQKLTHLLEMNRFDQKVFCTPTRCEDAK